MKQLYTQAQHANSNRHDSFWGSAATVQPFGGARRSARVPSLFPVRNKGKGPPGWAPAPEAVYSLPAAASAGSENSNSSFKKNNSNHNQLINIKSLSIMKKQILILVVIVLAAFANVNKSYGQGAVHVSSPKAAVTCTNDALHPIAGTPYPYSVTTDPTGGQYIWWATTNTTFINAGALNNAATGVLASPDVIATTASTYNQSTTAGSIELTWGTDVLAAATTTPTFVAVHYTPPTGAANCADNLKVYQIEPINAFIVDIKNVASATKTPLAYDVDDTQCFDLVQSAVWSGNAMTYNYGTNVLIFEVVAANFSAEWTPTFTLSGLNAAQSAVIEWDYDVNFTGTPVAVTSGTPSATPVSTSVTDTSDGVSIFVRVTVSNQTFEGLANLDIDLAVTGVNTANQRDVMADDCATAATLASNTATQTLIRRPTVTDNTDNGTFE